MSIGMIRLLQATLNTTGETEPQKRKNAKGEEEEIEVPSARKLNAIESAQRRHFVKATKEANDTNDAAVKAIVDPHNALLEEVKAEIKKEKKKATDDEVNELAAKDQRILDSLKSANEAIKALGETEYEVTLTDKTLELVKKCFKLFSEETGFSPADDEIIEKLEGVLK